MYGTTLKTARRKAQRCANRCNIEMAVGWTMNDVTGKREYGYCPSAYVGPLFVYEELELIQPRHPRLREKAVQS